MSIFKKKEKVVEPDITASASGNEEVDAEAIMRKYDKESNTRIWEGAPKIVITGVMVAFSVYCLCMTLFSLEQAETRLARFRCWHYYHRLFDVPSKQDRCPCKPHPLVRHCVNGGRCRSILVLLL